MLRDSEADIRKDLPAFNASALRGASVEVLSKNPAQDRRVLANLHGAHYDAGDRLASARSASSPIRS